MEIIHPQLSQSFKRIFHIRDKRPNQVQIEITNNCPLKCTMCPIDDFELPRKNMEMDLFNEIAEKIKYVSWVVPDGWGEPFIHPQFDKIIDTLKSNGIRIKMTTSGLLLNQKAMDTAMKIDYLAFSIDELEMKHKNGHYGNIKIVIDRIKKVLAKRKEKKAPYPYVTVQQVLYKGNRDTNKVIELAAELEVDRVNIIRPFVKFRQDLKQTWQERKKIYQAAEKLGKKLKIRVDMFEYAFFVGFRRWLWKHFKWIFRPNDWCPRLFDFMYITMDGKVTPCCELPRHIVGDLKTDSLENIWNGDKMEDFRKNHKEICKHCHIYKVGDC